MEYVPAENALWVALLCAEALLCICLVHTKIFRKFPLFFSSLVLEVTASLFLINIPRFTPAYAVAFSWYGTASAALRVGIVVELFSAVFNELRGTGQRFRDAVVGSALAAGVLFAGLSVLPLGRLHWGWPQTTITVLHQWQGTAFALAMVLVWAVLNFAVDVSNSLPVLVRSHWRILTVYLATAALSAMAVLLRGGGNETHRIAVVMLAVDILCCAAWIRAVERQAAPHVKINLSSEQILLIHVRGRDFFSAVRKFPAAVSDQLKSK